MVVREYPTGRSPLAPNVEHALRAAFREDRQGHGITVDRPLAAELDRIRGSGRPLPEWLVDLIGRRLNRDFADVRLHAGDRAAELASRLGTVAFCVGNDIFVDRRLLRCGRSTLTLEVLCHELAHIAGAVAPGTIRCWHGDGHAALTGLAFDEFKDEFAELVKIKTLHITKEALKKRLVVASNNMDYRHRIPTPFHPFETLRYLPNAIADLLSEWRIPILQPIFKQRVVRAVINAVPLVAKGEGPRHGEGRNYTDAGKGEEDGGNIDLNKKQQTEEWKQAVEEFKFDKAHDIDDWIPTGNIDVLGGVTVNEKEWVKSLGNALHTTQDRAAHREGRKGFGHDDRRTAWTPAWTPDDQTNDDHHGHDGEDGHSWWICNVAAFHKGFNNCCEVLELFFLETSGIGCCTCGRPRCVIHLEMPCPSGVNRRAAPTDGCRGRSAGREPPSYKIVASKDLCRGTTPRAVVVPGHRRPRYPSS